MPFLNPATYFHTINNADVTHSSKAASPQPWIVVRAESNTGDLLTADYWQFETVLPVRLSHVAKLQVVGDYAEAELATLFGSAAVQVTLWVTFNGGNCQTLLVNLA